MSGRYKPGPVLYAAAGAAIGFYCLGVLYRSGSIGIRGLFAAGLAPLAVLCLFRSAASIAPRLAGANHSRLAALAHRYAIAFAAGLALGVGAGAAADNPVGFGIPVDAVRGLSGVLLEDPRIVAGGRAMAALSLRQAAGRGGVRATARGELPVFFPEESALRLREFGRASGIFAEGALRQGRGGAAAPWLFSAESLHIVDEAPPIERFRTGVRLNLIRRFDTSGASSAAGGDDSWSGLALALLLGIRDNLDSGLAAQYREAGCSYILALSGMHLAVLAALISLLLKKPLGLKPAAIAGALIIVLYCFIVGPLPSLTRAALMYLLGVIAILGMLKRDALSLLGMAFIAQICVSPAQGYSLSFILSYLALAGILTVGESLAGVFRGRLPAALAEPLSASIGAFIATAAVTAFSFGVLRPVGMAAGLVLVPLTTVFMLGAMAYLAVNCVSPALSRLLEPPLEMLYRLMEKTVSLAGRVPGITADPRAVLWISLCLSLGILWLGFRRNAEARRLDSF